MADLPKLPGIPSITPVKDTTIAAILRPMKETLEILGSAISGNPLPNGSVVSSGFNTNISNTTITTINTGTGTADTTPPPTPAGLSVSAAFTNIIVSWPEPNYSNHAYTEIWRATTNVFANAVLQGFSPGAVYVDAVGTSRTFYYWIRFVSLADIAGPYNAFTGTVGGTGLVGGVDLGPLIIDATKLAADAVEEGKIKDYAITTTKIANLAVGNAAIANLAVSNAKIADLAVDDAKIANLAVGKLTAGSLSVGQYIRSTNFSSGSNGWNIDANGSAEFGAASIRGQFTASQIDSRNLTIKDSAGNVLFGAGTNLSTSYINGLGSLATSNSVNWNTQLTNIPSFGGFAYISSITSANISTYIAGAAIGEAYIANAAITEAKIASASISAAKIQDGQITNAKIGSFIQSTNYVAGSAGWNISKSGSAEFNDITVRSGQITGALMQTFKINSYSGLYVEISYGTPVSTTNGPYYLNGTGEPLYLVYNSPMPAPATAAHKIAVVANVQAIAGSSNKDLGVKLLINAFFTGGSGVTATELIAYNTDSGTFGISTNAAGVSSNSYATQVPCMIFVTGYNAAYTIQTIDGLAWGVR
jgi:hypothetical protein